jgi:hypothetical protein
MLDLSLRYEYNGTAHEDIILRFAGQSWTGDSYYFAIDRQLEPDDESPSKVKAVLRKLLDQWLTAATNLPDGCTVFLPYDFSDQSTSWICCMRDGNDVAVSQGWSAHVQGWSLSPSAVGEYLSDVPSFNDEGPAVKSSREDLLHAIRESLAGAE